MQLLIDFFGANGFLPHGYCLTWSSALLWLHVVSDVLIVLAYYSIPLTLLYFVRKRKDLPYPGLFAMFGLFIVACGTTHLLSVVTIWIPLYWLDGIVKALTAIISVAAALMMLWVVPRALSLRSPDQLEVEIQERKQAQAASQEALDRLNKIASQVPGVVFQFRLRPDGSSCVPYASEGIRQIYRVSPEAVRDDASPVFAVVHPDDLPQHLASIQASAQSLTTWHNEYRLKFAGEPDTWLLGNAIPQRESDGSVLWHGFINDITERKRAEETLRLKTEETEAFFSTALDLLCIANTDGYFLRLNPEWEKTLGYTLGELKEKRFLDFVHPEDREATLQVLSELSEQKPVINFTNRYRRKDGVYRWIEWRSVPAGTLVYAAARDITDRKSYEEELLRSNAELEQFSYAISHDMRQPLRTISSYLQLIEVGLADQLDGKIRGYFDSAVDGAKRIDQMLVALLEYSRVGRMGEPPTLTDSRATLEEALQVLRPAIAEAHAKLTVSGDWPRIFVRHDEILRLLQNLIDNAVKYRVAGRIPEITVSSESADNEWRLCVADNGVGIIPEQSKRLFQMFQRLQSHEAYAGTGVGLALCRKIAEHHKGRIWAESAGEGKGSRFYVVLPVLREKT
ncbi:MAG: PAS domain-containing protein [Sideroxyarcus sp.]|nr:PAS domain-containing protein [Sideroxyarcus sp.]